MAKKETENLKKKIEELQSGWIRTQADFDNYKKKTEVDKANWTDLAKENALFEILPILDNLHFAFKQIPADIQDNNWIKGVEHIVWQIDQKLSELGITRIYPKKNDSFDPNYHEALQAEQVKGIKPGKVLELTRPGYRIKGKVIRPAQVKVSK